jgi:hypothetical protein
MQEKHVFAMPTLCPSGQTKKCSTSRVYGDVFLQLEPKPLRIICLKSPLPRSHAQ